jgi:hypothetical protein
MTPLNMPTPPVDDDPVAVDALALLLPHLGALTEDPPVRINGTNDDYRGLTFDWALRRRDGTPVAVEVTCAWDDSFIEASDPWDVLCERVQATVRADHPEIVGRYVINAEPRVSRRANRQDLDGLVNAIVKTARAGNGSRVTIGRGTDVHNWTIPGEIDDLCVYATQAAGEFELGPENKARFERALADNMKKMTTAGNAGYETHLAIVHWMLGSTHSWRRFIEMDPPTFDHPQHVWAVDLNGRQGTQGRRAVELVHMHA